MGRVIIQSLMSMWRARSLHSLMRTRSLASDCGPVCMQLVLEYFGRYVPTHDVLASVGSTRDGVTALELVHLGERHGLEVTGVAFSRVEDLDSLVPCIVHTAPAHFVLHCGRVGTDALVVDPAVGERRIGCAEALREWTGTALLVAPGRSFQRRPRLLLQLRAAAALLHDRVWVVCGAFSGSMVTGWCLAYWLSAVLVADRRSGASIIVPVSHNAVRFGVFATVVLLTLGWIEGVLRDEVGRAAVRSLALRIRFSCVAILEDASGVLFGRLARVDPATGAFPSVLLTAIVVVLLSYWIVQGMAVLSSSVIAWLAVLAAVALARVSAERMAHRRMRALESSGTLERLASLHVSHLAYWTSPALAEELLRDLEESGAPAVSRNRLWPGPGVLAVIAVILIGGIGASRVSESWVTGALTGSVWFVLSTLTMTKLFSDARMWLQSVELFHGALLPAHATSHVPVRVSSQAASAKVLSASAGEQSRRDGLIPLLEVESAALPGNGSERPPAWVPDFSVGRGQRVVVVGATGTGKTQFARFLGGLPTAWQGQVRISGLAGHSLSREAMRATMGVAGQADRFFNGSIRDNIAAGCPDVTDAVIWQLLEQLGIAPLISAFPMGLSTPLLWDGGNVSSCERRMLLLARVLLPAPRLLVLDEPTAGLGVGLERSVLACAEARAQAIVVLSTNASSFVASGYSAIEIQCGVPHMSEQ